MALPRQMQIGGRVLVTQTEARIVVPNFNTYFSEEHVDGSRIIHGVHSKASGEREIVWSETVPRHVNMIKITSHCDSEGNVDGKIVEFLVTYEIPDCEDHLSIE